MKKKYKKTFVTNAKHLHHFIAITKINLHKNTKTSSNQLNCIIRKEMKRKRDEINKSVN